ncbi:hypothetical protein H6F51_10520 [Cyanobacteria bacterium FACHB-DQ100]|nr:hypothetical protein [Cyanobacteria bacterium FACHB-DQ100]
MPIEQQSNTLGFGLSGLLFVLAIAMQLETLFPREGKTVETPLPQSQPPQPAEPLTAEIAVQQTPAASTAPNAAATTPLIQPPIAVTPIIHPIIQDTDSYAVATPPPPSVVQAPEDILTKFAASPLGLVFTAPPGTGKTCTELGYLAKLFELYPDAIVRVVSRKQDSFLGLASVPRCVELIDPEFETFFAAITWVHSILHQRLAMPINQRGGFQTQPVRQVISDYYSTANSLTQQRKYRDRWEEAKAKLGDINTLGREVNVSAVIDTHSFNTAALGVSDGNIRDCLNIAALGKITRDGAGREDGGYGSIYKAINNKLVVDDDTLRQQLLKRDLPPLQQQSDRTGQPVLFTTMGTPRLLLLPDLRWAETYQLPREVLKRLANKLGTTLPEENAA